MTSSPRTLTIWRAVVRWRWVLLGALVTSMIALGWGATQALPPDNSLRVWFMDDDPRFADYDAYKDTFGHDEIIAVHLHPDGDVFTEATLKEIAEVTTAIDDLEHVARVYSVLDALPLQNQPGEPVPPSRIDLNASELQHMRTSALADPLMRDHVVSADGRQTLLIVEPTVTPNFDAHRDQLVRDIRDTVDAHLNNPRAALAGNGVIYQALNEVTARDFAVFLTVGLLVLFACLAWLTRSASLTLATIGVITAGTVAAIGGYGWAGHKLNLVTSLIPTLVMVLGIADAIHFPVALRRARRAYRGAPPEEVAARALASAALPCLMTTLTTAAGFLALTVAPIPAIAHLGLWAAVGVGTSLIACVILMSIVFVRRAARADDIDDAPISRLDRVVGALTHILHHHRAAAWASGIALTAALAAGAIAHLRVDTYTLGNLPEDHRVVRDHARIEEDWGAYLRLEFLATPTDPDALATDAESLRALEEFVRHAEQLDTIEHSTTVLSVYHHGVIQWLGPERAEQALKEVPDRAVALKRIATQAAPSHDLTEATRPVLGPEQRKARVMFTTPMRSARALGETLDELERLAHRHAPALTIEPVGYPPLYVGIIDQVMETLTQGFALALVLIFALIAVWLRSWRLAIASIVPNAFPLIAMFGAMGWLGIDLDIATASVAAIVLGVAVDDTIHFLHAYRDQIADGASWAEAVDATFEGAGRAAIITSMLLIAGFPVLMLSGVTSVFAFGLLTTIAAIAALIGDLILLPLTLRWIAPSSDH